MKRIMAHIIRIVSIIIIVIDVGSVIEKIKWYKNPMPGLSEMTDIKICIFWFIVGGICLFLASLYLKKR